MSILDKIVKELEQKAKTTNWIYETYFKTQKLKPLTGWVRLDDVKAILEKFEQKYFIIEKKKFKDEIVRGGLTKNAIINDLHQRLEKLIEEFISFKASFIEGLFQSQESAGA